MSTVIDIKSFDINDLNSDIPLALDTNVLLWVFYSRSSSTQSYQKNEYPTFISKVIVNDNPLIISAFNLNEMFHVIEKNECDIYNNNHNGASLRLKQFRKLTHERIKVKREIDLIYKQIQAIPNVKIVGSKTDMNELNSFVSKYEVHDSDFFDFWLINYCNENNFCIVTDDKDFVNSFNKNVVYTANPSVFKK